MDEKGAGELPGSALNWQNQKAAGREVSRETPPSWDKDGDAAASGHIWEFDGTPRRDTSSARQISHSIMRRSLPLHQAPATETTKFNVCGVFIQLSRAGMSQQSEKILLEQSKKFLLETGKMSG